MIFGRSIPFIVLGLLFLSGCENKTGNADNSAEKKDIRIAVIPKGLTHEHWKAVEAGAKKAAEEAGNVEIIWQGPPKEDDTNQQINLVQNCVSSGVSGIVLAPLSDQSLAPHVRAAVKSGIPVVIIDSALQGKVGEDFVAYVGTNNKAAGMIAGERMAVLLKNQGTVMMLRYAESSASTNEREQGFLEAVQAGAPLAKVIDPHQYAGADVTSAKRAAENMLTAYQGQFTAIFCPNESSTEGMLLAMEDRQLAGPTTFVGFDVNKRLIRAMKAGKIHGLVLQNPFRMGYDGVKTLLAHMKGEQAPPEIDTGAVLVTPDNLSIPEIDRVIPASAK